MFLKTSSNTLDRGFGNKLIEEIKGAKALLGSFEARFVQINQEMIKMENRLRTGFKA